MPRPIQWEAMWFLESGQYAPETREGKRLIAHELSHVVQQQNTPGIFQRKLSIGSTTDCAELAADAVARAVMQPENSPFRSSTRKSVITCAVRRSPPQLYNERSKHGVENSIRSSTKESTKDRTRGWTEYTCS